MNTKMRCPHILALSEKSFEDPILTIINWSRNPKKKKKSCVQETLNILTCADSSTTTK